MKDETTRELASEGTDECARYRTLFQVPRQILCRGSTRIHADENFSRFDPCESVLIRGRLSRFLQHLDRIEHPLRSFFVFEIREDVAAVSKMLVHPPNHCLAFLRTILRLAIAVVAEVGRHDVGCDPLFGFGYT